MEENKIVRLDAYQSENPNNRKEAKGFLRSMIMLIPNFLLLLGRLFKDSRVPLAEKAILVGAIAYVISPLDLIPDVIPVIGQVDDLYLIALVVLRLLARTDDAVLQEHWEGRGDLASTVNKIARAAQYVLPKRMQRILLGRVDIAPKIKGGIISSPAAVEDIDDARERQARR
ncbi:MAG TPA: YkvA family protein [Blastocatellia bacterium]|nr:YkvA family protein [Blastocatellia bacterium]